MGFDDSAEEEVTVKASYDIFFSISSLILKFSIGCLLTSISLTSKVPKISIDNSLTNVLAKLTVIRF